MRKIFVVMLALMLMGCAASAQSYTVTTNGCGAKNLGYCTLQVTDQTNAPYQIVVDHRANAQGFIDRLVVETAGFPATVIYPGPTDNNHFTITGFVDTPPSHTDVNGVLTIDTDDGRVHAELEYVAHYVWTCSGRGCAGTQVGWHYFVNEGSVITVQ